MAKPQGGKEGEKLKRDITPMFDYYKAWDKFTKETDDDNNDLNDFEEAKNPTPVPDKVCNTQAEMMQRTSGAKPGTKMVIKGGTVKQNNMADTLK